MDVRLVLTVALVLAGIGSLSLGLIARRRKEESRFYFHLSWPFFVILVGSLMLVAPRGAAMPLWLLGTAAILYGLINLAWLIAQRFNVRWLIVALSGSIPWVLRCSFCNKSQRAVRKLIAGRHVYICDECVKICQAILDGETDPQPEAPTPQPTVS